MAQTFYYLIFATLIQSLKQLSTFSSLRKLKFDDNNKKNVVSGGDFNFVFDCKFNASGGNPILKKKSLAKLIGIKETL